MTLVKKSIPSKISPIPILITDNLSPSRLCIIETHGGIKGNKEEVAKASTNLKEYCKKNEFIYITYDLLNNGTRTGGSPNEVLFSQRIEDLVNLISYVKKTYKCPILLIGSSLGGLITINAAAQISSGIVGLVINCGVINPEKTLRILMGNENFDTWEQKGIVKVFDLDLPANFLKDITSLQTLKNLRNLSIPILWFHGTADPLVPIEQVKKAQLTNPQINLIIIPEGGHRFGDKMLPGEWLEQVESFISNLPSS